MTIRERVARAICVARAQPSQLWRMRMRNDAWTRWQRAWLKRFRKTPLAKLLRSLEDEANGR